MHMVKLIGAAVMAASLAAGATAQGLTEDIGFNVVNQTDTVITAVYLSTSSDPNWGLDIAEDFIGPGDAMTVYIYDDLPDCYYDMAMMFSDGDTLAYGEVDVCSLNGETLVVE